MEVNVALPDGLSLEIAERAAGGGAPERSDRPHSPEGYPSGRLQKGLLLLDRGERLAEEAVGFGVPVLKRGVQTIFPGGVKLASHRERAICTVTAVFEMNLVERLAGNAGERLRSRSLYAVKNTLAALHRHSPALRGPLTATSNALRRTFGWVTTFEETESVATLTMTYVVDAGEGRVAVSLDIADAPLAGVTEVVVMNEQGARHFDRYVDDDGTRLQSDEIGTWDEVKAKSASFVSSARRLAFSLGQVDGARLYRGRELIGSRVAWSGFGYSFPPGIKRSGYDLRIERIHRGDSMTGGS